MANVILPPKAPNLPLAPSEYLRAYFDQLTSILRLYFNQLDGYNTAVSPAVGSFAAVTSQSVAAANTATKIHLDTTLVENGISIDATGTITVAQPGKYLVNYTVSGNVGSWGGGAARVIWLRLNGTNAVESARNTVGSYVLEVSPSDYVEFYWASSSSSDVMTATSATGYCPAIPAATLTMNFIST